MRHGLVAVIISLALAWPSTGAFAEADDQACAGGGVSLPDDLAGWAGRSPVDAAGEASGLARAVLAVGHGVDARLKPVGELHYVAPPEKPGDAASYGGLFAFAVPRAGTYRVALGAGAWVDVLKDGTAIASTAHGHRPACTGISKVVAFPLTPGRYTLQIAGNGDPVLAVMVAPAP
ncbi:MAG TPA: homogentisate 1,2-dioxygenase [Sphingomonadaceae bacterium]|nr:homogentisate 1,2-dioxygenase [Sphingomonadaceae bacterium]